VTQAMNDKAKGNTGRLQREINKAVRELRMLLEEDPADFEAFGLPGMAYADGRTALAKARRGIRKPPSRA
jgi:hypothetical protein